ncbi:MAG: tetratricopeptide repeat protein [Thermoleophilaceae bacterium]|nr:tetratricopeptide repeat protein [Thermoleophilaceae bacterium]
MALRLTTPSAGGVRQSAADLAELARARLARGEGDAYRALFSEAAREEDPNERYRLRMALLQAGVEAAAYLSGRRLAEAYVQIARAGVEALEEEPREPSLLNHVGVAFYEVGALQAAEALFKAARRLDPELPHLRRNLEELARRRRMGVDLLRALPKPLALALGTLTHRAERVAERARPAEGLTISLCMIVKDEEEMLPRCLEAAHRAVDEIVIVDTGSTDRTIEIAESYGARVIEAEWTGSFADARNISFEAATGDWLLYLDADEVIVAEDAPKLRELAGHVWREAFFFVETNFTGDLDDGTAVNHNTLRMFRNRPHYRFEGRIHEQIAHRLPSIPERLERPSVRIEHYGYLGAVRDAKEKSRRNIELLERQVADGEDTPFLHFNLGSEHAAAGDAERARERFAKAWRLLENDPERTAYGYVPSLTNRYVKALRVTGRHAEARAVAEEGLRLFPGFTDLVLEQAHVARALGDLDEAARLIERCLEMGDAPSRYSPMVGCGSYVALNALADIRREQGELAEAEALLDRALREHPTYLGSVRPLAEAMLARGVDPEEVAAHVEQAVETPTASTLFMLGVALYEAGHVEVAEARFRAVLDKQPSSDAARVALAEALLSQKRWQEAAEAARGVLPESSHAAPACRAELFARIVSGDREGAERALAEAARGALPAGEVALFRAWHDAACGRPLPAALSGEAAPLLGVTLEALLRVQEVEAFAQLVPLVERIGLDRREQRELLASIYLRRGFLESAGDEWAAACEEHGPDARALLGLAQVAYARGREDDAVLFASTALELEPDNAGARRMLERLEPQPV